MNDKTLVLITYQFPYLPGEYFIESEIGYLAAKFARVIVLPIRLAWVFGGQLGDRRNIAAANVEVEAGFTRLHHVFLLVRALIEAPWLVARYRRRWSGHPDVADRPLGSWLRSGIKASLAKAAIRRVSRRMRRHHGADAIYYSYWRLEAAAAAAMLKESGTIGALVCRCHGGDLYLEGRYPFEDLIHRQADGVLPVSDDGAAFLVQGKGLPKENICVQRLGVRLPPTVSPGSADGVLRILSCSNLIAGKRVQLIADYVARSPFPIEWVHFGDGEERPRVERIIRAFDDSKSATLKGRVPNSGVYEHYATRPVDLFVNLSDSEGVPVSIMEALAFGVPVIATAVGGTPEIVDETCGYLMSRECSFEAFLAGITHVTGSDPQRFRTAARRRAEALCDAQANYERTCDLISRLAAARPNP